LRKHPAIKQKNEQQINDFKQEVYLNRMVNNTFCGTVERHEIIIKEMKGKIDSLENDTGIIVQSLSEIQEREAK
jgi:hypothetical protein